MTDTTARGSHDAFDARAAALLLDRTTQDTVRRVEPFPPGMTVLRGVLALACCTALWLSVRGQHPYRGPALAVAIPVIAVFVLVNFGATVAIAGFRMRGVSGRSRLRPVEVAVLTVGWMGVYVVMGVLAGAGVSRSIVYGWYPTAVPLVVAGLAWVGISAVRRNSRGLVLGVAVAVVGAGAALAGPRGSWLVAGVGICLVLLVNAVVTVQQQRRPVVRL